MKKTLTFNILIQASRRRVWETMLGAEGYQAWTSVFCEGSHYTGSWEAGSRIDFLAPGGDGMTAVIAENRPFEYVSIRHLGVISQGVEDTTSDAVRAWAPAYENYALADADGATRLTVSLETMPEHEQFMQETFPKALNLLKALCEREDGH